MKANARQTQYAFFSLGQCALFLIFALVWGCAFVSHCDQFIADAARKYAAARSSLGSLKVQVERVRGDYARARVIPVSGKTDAAWIFLRHENGSWIGLALGTAFAPNDYVRLGIPEELRVE